MASSSERDSEPDDVRHGTVETDPAERSTSMLGSVIAVVGAALSALYLLNLGFGVIDIVPDNLPGVGNLDEATVTAILVSCLGYLGIRLPFAGGRGKSK